MDVVSLALENLQRVYCENRRAVRIRKTQKHRAAAAAAQTPGLPAGFPVRGRGAGARRRRRRGRAGGPRRRRPAPPWRHAAPWWTRRGNAFHGQPLNGKRCQLPGRINQQGYASPAWRRAAPLTGHGAHAPPTQNNESPRPPALHPRETFTPEKQKRVRDSRDQINGEIIIRRK